MRICSFLFTLCLCTALWTSCNKSNSGEADESQFVVDLSQYKVEDIPGSNRKMVTKLTEQGLLMEQGMVENGLKVGTWTKFYAQNTKPMETWTYENGKLNGLHFLFNNSGRVDMYESYLDNKLHGKRVTFKYGSPVEEMSYKNGKLDGIFRGFFPTGRLQRVGYFKDGLQDGKYIVYDENKNIVLQVNYVNGVEQPH
ncbi:MAG: toxin-antitoxin system YwqK family antitoxin [Saprospiraceae bacterium]|nr:toxin-antitoxin system YwqK family antitoxin [Saprospiraceae bacterium]